MKQRLRSLFQNKSVLWRFLVSTLLPCLLSVIILVAILLPLLLTAANSNDRAYIQNMLYVVSTQFDALSDSSQDIQGKIEKSSWLYSLYIDHVLGGKELSFPVRDQILKDLSVFASQSAVVSYISLQFYEDPDVIYSSTGVVQNLQFYQTHMPEKQQYFFFPMENGIAGLDTVYFQNESLLLCRLPVSVVDGGQTKAELNIIFHVPLIEKKLLSAVGNDVAAFRISDAGGKCLWSWSAQPSGSVTTASCPSADGVYLYELDIPRSVCHRTTSRILPIVLLAVLLDLVICILSAHYFSRQNYQPLHTIIQRLSDDVQSDCNEWTSLNTLIDQLQKESQDNLHYLDSLRPLARQRILQALLQGDIQSQDTLPSQLQFCQMMLDAPLFYVVSLLLPFSQLTEASSQQAMPRQLTEFARASHLEALQGELPLRAYAQFVDMDHATLLVNCSCPEDLTAYCQRILTSCAETFRLQAIRIGIGMPVSQMSEIYRSADQAVSALRYATVNQHSDVVFYTDIPSQTATPYVYPISEELRLSRFLAAGDLDSAKALLSSLIESNRPYFETDLESMSWFYHDLCSTVIRSVQGLGVTLNRNQQKKRLRHLDSPAQLQLLSMQLMDDICAQLDVRQAEASGNGQEILAFIDENLYNPALSLDMIADRFQKSTAYVSVLFKRLKGVNYSEYITQTRILYAVELMSQKNMSIEQVCEAAGFSSLSTFRRNFIKYTHQNPGDFLNR